LRQRQRITDPSTTPAGISRSPIAGDDASKLIATVLSNGLIPVYLQTQFNALRAVLETGVPTVRNKTAGHGQGDQIQEVPEYLAAYVLHQTAAAILFLVKAHKAKP
jgi:hypothetical protein